MRSLRGNAGARTSASSAEASLAATMGLTSSTLAIYRADQGVTNTGGNADAWAPAYGSAPTMAKGSATGPTVTGAGTAMVVRTDASKWMEAAASDFFNLSRACSIVYVGTLDGAQTSLIISNAALTRYHGFKATAAKIQGISTTGNQNSLTDNGASRRMAVWSHSQNYSGTGGSTLTTVVRWFSIASRLCGARPSEVAVMTSENAILRIGALTSGATFNVDDIRCILFAQKQLTRADLIAIQDYVEAQHTVTFDTTKPIVLCEGNSLTAGAGAASGANSWPAQMQALAEFTTAYDVANFGTGSRTGAEMVLAAPGRIHPFNNPRLGVANKRILVMFEWGNDRGGGSTSAAALANERTIIDQWKADGGLVFSATIPPRGDITGAEETDRVAVNVTRLAGVGTWLDGCADFAGRAEFQNIADTTYFNADTIHWTTALNTIAASMMRDTIAPFL